MNQIQHQPAATTYEEPAIFHYEIINGVQEAPVFGDEYILTHADSGR